MHRLFVGLMLFMFLLTGCGLEPAEPPSIVMETGWKWFEIREAKILLEYPSDGKLTRFERDGLSGYRLTSQKSPIEIRFIPEPDIFITSINATEATEAVRELASQQGKVLSVTNTRLNDVTYFLDTKMQLPSEIIGISRIISRKGGAWSMLVVDPHWTDVHEPRPDIERILDSVTLRR